MGEIRSQREKLRDELTRQLNRVGMGFGDMGPTCVCCTEDLMKDGVVRLYDEWCSYTTTFEDAIDRLRQLPNGAGDNAVDYENFCEAFRTVPKEVD